MAEYETGEIETYGIEKVKTFIEFVERFDKFWYGWIKPSIEQRHFVLVEPFLESAITPKNHKGNIFSLEQITTVPNGFNLLTAIGTVYQKVKLINRYGIKECTDIKEDMSRLENCVAKAKLPKQE
jgi:hypothetical protein